MIDHYLIFPKIENKGPSDMTVLFRVISLGKLDDEIDIEKEIGCSPDS